MAPLTHLPLNALQNFTDPKTGLAMMTRMGFRPNENYCDGLHVVYLGGQRLAFTHSAGRLQDGFPGDVGVAHPEGGLSVGGLSVGGLSVGGGCGLTKHTHMSTNTQE